MRKRVVITGLGVCAPNGMGLADFSDALRTGKSGIRFQSRLKELNFRCQIAGEPLVKDNVLHSYFSPLQLRGLNASGLVYGLIAGADAWKDAQLPMASKDRPDWAGGIVFGTGILGADKFREAIRQVDDGDVRRLGSTTVQQIMASGISAYLGGILGCGNQVTTNSAACTTGTESLIMAYERVASGKADYMLAGSCSDSGPYIWGGFDALRILPTAFNDNPSEASRPMSASASGFVPGSGAGALVVESLESAQKRGVRIYAEVLGGATNSGGQRGGGSMTAANDEAVQRCILGAISEAGIHPLDIDTINGHLTATTGDGIEISNWSRALERSGQDFPYINAFKGTTGHCLAASGSIECVGTMLQYQENKIFKNVNCQDIHPRITEIIAPSQIPRETIDFSPRITAKASFGFGDVNACVIFGRYKE